MTRQSDREAALREAADHVERTRRRLADGRLNIDRLRESVQDTNLHIDTMAAWIDETERHLRATRRETSAADGEHQA